MTRSFAVLSICILSNCATVLPMQPASVLPEGQLRMGGQVTVAPLCGLTRNYGQDCAAGDNGLPLPEFRFNARRGMGKQSDVGFSVQLAPWIQSARPVQLGLTLDGKHEIWSRSLGDGRRQIVSANFGIQGSTRIGNGKPGSRTEFQLDGVIPVQFGHQTERFEWVVSLGYLHRFRFESIDAPLPPPVTDAPWLQLSLGVFRRSPGSWSLQVGYLTPAAQPLAGSLQIGYALHFDVGAAAALP